MAIDRRALAIATSYLLLTAVFTWPVFAQPDATGWQDWDFHLFMHGAVLKNLIEYGQLPLWNPWYCGGNVLLPNPQAPLFSPTFLLVSVVSLPFAMKINIALHYWLGLMGMHLVLTRIFGLRFLPGIVFLASAFALSGAVAMHLAYGHAIFLPAFYLPYLVFFFFRALETGSVKYAIAGGTVLALTVFEGGVHVMPLGVVIVASIALVSSAARRSWQPLAMAAILGMSGGLLAAPKILPLVLFVSSPHFADTRLAPHPDLMSMEMLVRSLVDPYQNRGLGFDGQIYSWIEYGNYVGLPFVLVALASAAWIIGDRRIANRWFGLSLATAMLFIAVLTAGEFASWAPASIFLRLPFFSKFRVPSRYTIAAVLSAVMTVAWAAKTLDLDGLVSRARIAIAVLCLLGTADLVMRNRLMLGGSFIQDPITERFRPLGGPRTLVTDTVSKPHTWGSPMLRTLMKGESIFQCYEVMRLDEKADATHPLIWQDGDAKIFSTRFSPNRVVFSVSGGREPSRVRLNQNFAAGWTTDAGAIEPDPQTGQPSVVLHPGQTGTFSFVFMPPGFLPGCLLALIGLAGSAYGWRRRIAPSAELSGRFR